LELAPEKRGPTRRELNAAEHPLSGPMPSRYPQKEGGQREQLALAFMKVKMALRLRRESIMTLKWIAQRLHMESWTHVNHLLYWHRRKNVK